MDFSSMGIHDAISTANSIMSAPPTLLEPPLVDEDDFTEIAADLFAVEDTEFAAFRERRKHSNIMTMQD
eukprot:1764711-Rhodomonas_salina.1